MTVNCCYAGDQCEGKPRYPDTVLGRTNQTVYVSWPSGLHIQEGKGIVLVPDVNGLWHNSRLLADQFALAGYLTIVAPYNSVVREEDKPPADASKDPLEPKDGEADDAEEKRKKAYREAVEHAIGYLRSSESGAINKIGIVAYSDGARAVMDILRENTRHYQVAAAFLGTPILDSPTDLADIRTPTSIAFADEHDNLGCGNSFETHGQIERELINSSYPFQMSIYSHVHEGFAQRRRFTTKAEIFAKRQAFIQAITWMQEHLLGDESYH